MNINPAVLALVGKNFGCIGVMVQSLRWYLWTVWVHAGEHSSKLTPVIAARLMELLSFSFSFFFFFFLSFFFYFYFLSIKDFTALSEFSQNGHILEAVKNFWHSTLLD